MIVAQMPPEWLSVALRAARAVARAAEYEPPEFVAVRAVELPPHALDAVMPDIWWRFGVDHDQAAGIETGHISIMGPGARVPPHVDRDGPHLGRLLAVSIILEPADVGGRLIVDGSIHINAGVGVAYPIGYEHSVTEVVAGQRLALICRIVDGFGAARSPLQTWTPDHRPGMPYRHPRPVSEAERARWAREADDVRTR